MLQTGREIGSELLVAPPITINDLLDRTIEEPVGLNLGSSQITAFARRDRGGVDCTAVVNRRLAQGSLYLLFRALSPLPPDVDLVDQARKELIAHMSFLDMPHQEDLVSDHLRALGENWLEFEKNRALVRDALEDHRYNIRLDLVANRFTSMPAFLNISRAGSYFYRRPREDYCINVDASDPNDITIRLGDFFKSNGRVVPAPESSRFDVVDETVETTNFLVPTIGFGIDDEGGLRWDLSNLSGSFLKTALGVIGDLPQGLAFNPQRFNKLSGLLVVDITQKANLARNWDKYRVFPFRPDDQPFPMQPTSVGVLALEDRSEALKDREIFDAILNHILENGEVVSG